MKKNNQFDIMPGMNIVEAAAQSVVRMVKRTIENIGVEIPAQTGPISQVTGGSGKILPSPQAEILRVQGTGSRRAVMRRAFNYPEKVVNALNPKDLQALREPLAAEAAFHQQWAEKSAPDDYQDFSTPMAERQLGRIEYMPDDRRIKYLEIQYGLGSGSIRPKILTDGKRPVSVFDYVRSDGRVSGPALVPVEENWRTVMVPDIAGAIGAKNAETVIAALGFVDPTKGEETSIRQAAVRQAVVEAAGKRAMGLTPELVMFTAQAFLAAAENPKLPAKEVVSGLLS